MSRLWLSRLRRSWIPAPSRKANSRPLYRPQLECLEERTTPTAFHVSTLSDDMSHNGTSLRDAIALASTDSAAGISDTIDFSGLAGSPTITLVQGQLQLNRPGAGTITIDGGGQITLNANSQSRVFSVASGVQAVLSGLTLLSGNPGASVSGGGILNSGTLTVNNCTISGSVGPNAGGGIENLGTLTVNTCTLSSNTAGTTGGGIDNQGTLLVLNSTITTNSAVNGAGIENRGTLTVGNSTISGNTATGGGGLHNRSLASIADTTFSNNTASSSGGAILNETAFLSVTTSTLTNNSANVVGGGIDNDSGTVTVTNSTLANNSASSGGAVANLHAAAALTLASTTVASNSATDGGGITNTSGGTTTLQSSIVAGNSATTGPDINGSVAGASAQNLVGNGANMSGISNNDPNANIVGQNPLLGLFANNGGPTKTFSLQSGSPALGHGGPSTLLIAGVGASDTTLSVGNAAAIAASPGKFLILIGTEQMLVTDVNLTSNTLTVRRGANATTAVAHSGNTPVYPALDQRGLPRPSNGQLDIGAFQTQGTTPAPTLALAVSTSSSVYGQPVTFTVTVSGPGPVVPTGNVTFYDGPVGTGTVIGTAALDGNGMANLLMRRRGVGPHSLNVAYTGDSNFAAATTGGLSAGLTIRPTTTTLTLMLSTGSSVYGQPVTFTVAAGANSPSTLTPNGLVMFYDGAAGTGTLLGTALLDSQGTASLIMRRRGVGTHTLNVIYAGNGSFTGSFTGTETGATAASATLTVSQAPTAVTLALSSSSCVFGQPVTFTALASSSLSSFVPTGTISFYDGPTDTGTLMGTATMDTSGLASIVLRHRDAGVHLLNAVYSGNANFTSSASTTPAMLSVNQADCTTSLAVSAGSSIYGQPIIFTATVQAAAPSTGLPSGLVSFYDGTPGLAPPLVTVALDGNGIASTSVRSLDFGPHNLFARYLGNQNFNSSTSTNPPSVSVGTAGTSTLASISTMTSVFGQPVDLTATVVNAAGAGSLSPTGTVTLWDGAVNTGLALGTAMLDNGVATLTMSQRGLGPHAFNISYTSDNSNRFADSVTTQSVSLSVNQGFTTLALSVDNSSPVFGQPVVVTALASPVSPSNLPPSGSVAFYDGPVGFGEFLGSVLLDSSGQASLTLRHRTVGLHLLTAVYSGNGSFVGSSTTQGLSLLVQQANTSLAVTLSASTAPLGQPVTATAAVTAVPPGGNTPSGTVTFWDGPVDTGTFLGTATVNAFGQAMLVLAHRGLGTHSINASYSGDPNFFASSTTIGAGLTII